MLESTIHSILSQSCKDFNLVVVDDASPYHIKAITDKFSDIRYVRFDTNLGGSDLVAHWDRCVQLVDTRFIWLFSDDDHMDSNCVEAFYETVGIYPDHDVYRFNTRVDYLTRGVVEDNLMHPSFEDSRTFLLQKITRNRNSYMPEYIFRRQVFLDCGGHFVDFPLAWNSDDASWAVLAKERGIRTIYGPKITWRFGGGSISSQQGNYHSKISADIQFSRWAISNFHIPEAELKVMRIWRIRKDYLIPLLDIFNRGWWKLLRRLELSERIFYVLNTLYPARVKSFIKKAKLARGIVRYITTNFQSKESHANI